MKLFLEIIGWLMVLFTLLPTIQTTKWWIRVLDFPRMQIAIISILILVFYLYFFPDTTTYQYLFAGSLGFVLILQSRYIYPFTVFSPKQAIKTPHSNPKNIVRLMISNVQMSNRNAKKYIDIVQTEKPDLILVNEPDHWWAKQLEVIDKDYPYSVKHPLSNTYGMMFYSRFKLLKANVQFLVEDDTPSVHTIIELPSGDEIEFCGVHPKPPMVNHDTDEREAELLLVGKSVKESKRATIVAGDLNDVGWSHTTKLFQRISQLIDPRIGRGFFNTYNVHIPFFRYPLDHVFYDTRFKLVELKRLPPFGSDHFPILITLAYEPEVSQPTPEKAKQEEKEEAEELIAKGLHEDK